MYRINRIKVTGFRRIHNIDIVVNPLMVLIGANGVGKTTMLDAFSLLSSAASGSLNSNISRLGGISNILTRGKSEELSLLVDMSIPNYEPIEYKVTISPKNINYSIKNEILSQPRPGRSRTDPFKHIDSIDGEIRYYEIDNGRLVRPNWEYDFFETSLSQVPKMFSQPEALRRILATATNYHALDVGNRAPIKLPQQMKPALLPGNAGEDLIPYLYYLRETDHDKFESIVDTLKSAFRDFKELNFPPVAAGTLSMTWKDKNFTKPLYLHELSEGTLRFLWLVSLLHSPNLSTVTTIDEPEVSLHPELLGLLAGLMREASKRTQLIIATHSDRLIRFLNPEEVVAMDVDECGMAAATWGSDLDLERWLKDYSLDEIWLMGRMGGRA